MKVVVPREITPNENRVALTPESVTRLSSLGVELLVESGAGQNSHITDQQYEEAGARVLSDARSLFGEADIVLKVQKPYRNDALGQDELDLIKAGTALIGFLQPLTDLELVQKLVDRKITSFSMDTIPRITRCQPMDALSAMSTLTGYKAVVLAATSLGKLFPLMMTAAGTLAPSRVFVLGAGVAGLQAIATARRLGAVVEAFDTRPAVKEQVESLGASFVEMELPEESAEGTGGYAREMSDEYYRRQQEMMLQHLRTSDVVITTALIPGRRAPILITEDMVKAMRPGSVIVDLAADMGGNCEVSEPGREPTKYGVIIHAPLNFASTMPVHATQMYSRNVTSLLSYMLKDGQLHLDFDDEVVSGTCITHQGEILNGQVLARMKEASA